MTATYTFKPGKYTRWYYQLIDYRRRNKPPKSEYSESHHIMPESFFIKRTREGARGWLEGNPNARSNKVRVTGREHALCHWLLTKMTADDERANDLMVYAFIMMDVSGEHMGRSTSAAIVRAYARNREVWAKNHSRIMKKQFEDGRVVWNKGLDMKDDPRCKGGKKNKGRKMDPSVGEATRARKLGVKQSEETCEKRRQSMTGYVRGPMSDEEKLKRSVGGTGVKKREGHRTGSTSVGNISINKDGKEKRVKSDTLQSFLNDGWALGGRPRNLKA